MKKLDDISFINNWFKTCNIDNWYIPFILGFFAVLFQVAAWYSHTTFPESYSMFTIIILSWLIALIEFIFLVPAISIADNENIDLTFFTVYKITLFFVFFSLFNTFILGNKFMLKYLIAYVLMGFSIYLLK